MAANRILFWRNLICYYCVIRAVDISELIPAENSVCNLAIGTVTSTFNVVMTPFVQGLDSHSRNATLAYISDLHL